MSGVGSASPRWLTDHIEATMEFARETGFVIARDICLTRVALYSGADNETSYFTAGGSA